MPIFGKTLFESVLDGLAADEDEAAPAEPLFARSDGLLAASMVSAFADHSDEAVGTSSDLYGGFDDDLPPADKVPDWLGRLSEAEVRQDLGLEAGLPQAVIRERRREFARLNHPDRVPEAWRMEATIRMKIANRILDEALLSVRRQG